MLLDLSVAEQNILNQRNHFSMETPETNPESTIRINCYLFAGKRYEVNGKMV